jgi:hypothetical protein
MKRRVSRGGLMGALKHLQAELKGALHLCHTATHAARPHIAARTAARTDHYGQPAALRTLLTACDYQSGNMGK